MLISVSVIKVCSFVIFVVKCFYGDKMVGYGSFVGFVSFIMVLNDFMVIRFL